MKITSEIYKFEKVVNGTVEIEIDDQNPTYISGRAGGDSYVACFIPRWCPKHEKVWDKWVEDGVQLLGFTVIACNSDREARVQISESHLKSWHEFKQELKPLPHAEDIINFFTGEGEEYNHRVCTEESFREQLAKWRMI
mgnify:CR=1 FL=1